MTAAEAQMMADHVAYWSSQPAPAGPVVVFGPVADPAGTWGMPVITAASESAVWALIDHDPVRQRGDGFTYEVLHMPGATTSPGE